MTTNQQKEMTQTGPPGQDDRTIVSGADAEFINELSEFLDTLASPVRLHILSFIGKNPRTIRQISHEIGTSYENSKKHVIRLLELGVIRKEIGVSQDMVNHGQPVFFYSLEPGSLDSLVSSLRVFSSITAGADPVLNEKIASAAAGLNQTFQSEGPSLTLKNGPDASRVFLLTADIYRIGREEPGLDSIAHEPAVLIPETYRSVSRVSGPHAWLVRRNGVWTLRDGESKGGTFLDGRRVSEDIQEPLRGGSRIELAQGPLGAILVFSMKAGINSETDLSS
ncbi:MAG: FHA domain-containing protein [Methanobacteriota archaeon]